MDWIGDFFGSFDGPAWTTLVISLGAVIVSVVSLLKTRTPRPHWEVVRVTKRWEYPDDGPLGFRPMPKLMAGVVIHQAGPGNAERVSTQLVLPDGRTTSWREIDTHTVTRGTEITLDLGEAEPENLGRFVVRIKYRCLPDTTKVRRRTKRFVWDPALAE